MTTPKASFLLSFSDRFRRRSGQRGQGMIEYALILILIAIAAVIAVTVLGQQTSDSFGSVTAGLAGSTHGGAPAAPKTAQTITITSTPVSPQAGGTYQMMATASSNLAVSLTTSSAACAITGTTVLLLAAGSCEVDVNQAGNATYAAAPEVTQIITVAANPNDDFTTAWSGDGGGNGWSVLGSQASIDSDETNQPGLTITASTPGSSYCPSWNTLSCDTEGIYKAAPSGPFTVTTEVNATLSNHWQEVLLFVGDADATDLLDVGVVQNSNGTDWVASQDMTNPEYVATHADVQVSQTEPIYLRLVVNSSTDIDVDYSYNGSGWTTLSTDITNASFSGGVTTVGLAVVNDSNSSQPPALFDWIHFTTP